jgi:hypothetical protein
MKHVCKYFIVLAILGTGNLYAAQPRVLTTGTPKSNATVRAASAPTVARSATATQTAPVQTTTTRASSVRNFVDTKRGIEIGGPGDIAGGGNIDIGVINRIDTLESRLDNMPTMTELSGGVYSMTDTLLVPTPPLP